MIDRMSEGMRQQQGKKPSKRSTADHKEKVKSVQLDLRSITTPKKTSDFEVTALLGAGGFGSVFLCKEKASGKFYAVKKMSKCSVIEKNKVHLSIFFFSAPFFLTH